LYPIRGWITKIFSIGKSRISQSKLFRVSRSLLKFLHFTHCRFNENDKPLLRFRVTQREAERAEREAEEAAEAARLEQERADMAPYIVGSI